MTRGLGPALALSILAHGGAVATVGILGAAWLGGRAVDSTAPRALRGPRPGGGRDERSDRRRRRVRVASSLRADRLQRPRPRRARCRAPGWTSCRPADAPCRTRPPASARPDGIVASRSADPRRARCPAAAGGARPDRATPRSGRRRPRSAWPGRLRWRSRPRPPSTLGPAPPAKPEIAERSGTRCGDDRARAARARPRRPRSVESRDQRRPRGIGDERDLIAPVAGCGDRADDLLERRAGPGGPAGRAAGERGSRDRVARRDGRRAPRAGRGRHPAGVRVLRPRPPPARRGPARVSLDGRAPRPAGDGRARGARGAPRGAWSASRSWRGPSGDAPRGGGGRRARGGAVSLPSGGRGAAARDPAARRVPAYAERRTPL